MGLLLRGVGRLGVRLLRVRRVGVGLSLLCGVRVLRVRLVSCRWRSGRFDGCGGVLLGVLGVRLLRRSDRRRSDDGVRVHRSLRRPEPLLSVPVRLRLCRSRLARRRCWSCPLLCGGGGGSGGRGLGSGFGRLGRSLMLLLLLLIVLKTSKRR